MEVSMRSFVFPLFAAFALGCSQGHNNNDPGADGGTDGPTAAAHAEGSVSLGETHQAKSGKPTPIISAAFAPGAIAGASAACGATDVAGCKVTRAPKCSVACAAMETCAWDDQCMPTCKPACTKACQPGEECYFPSLGADAQCRRKEAFDSGSIVINGAISPIELDPPYSFTSTGTGAPFAPGASLDIQASGAQITGFSSWHQSVTATTPLTTGLGTLAMNDVYGTSPLDVTWTAGSDTIAIAVGGLGGSATCDANDGDGTFAIPREVLDEALGGSSTLSISISRKRSDVQKGIATKGTLATAKVPAEGWVTVSTFSTESTSFQACANATQAACGGTCTDTSSNNANCGKCGNACSNGQQCVMGTCTTVESCSSCATTADMTKCKSQYDACQANPSCVALGKCLAGCANQTCAQNCASMYSSILNIWNAHATCICNTACSLECKKQCGG
jgi:hypothetical protein